MSLTFINPYTGKPEKAVFCFTGKSPKPRSEMQKIAIQAGGSVTKSITNQTTILVIADPQSQSAKAKRARQKLIYIISPEEFFKMCQHVSTIIPEVNKKVYCSIPKKENKYSQKRRIKL
ncbi:MAG: BRCT domain-containing protein [Candidatus Heimdallarchaeota archaeon]|nr:MAG: BRCT domain-containing protein [Candidatus Heimdallarchaeota archaeon]